MALNVPWLRQRWEGMDLLPLPHHWEGAAALDPIPIGLPLHEGKGRHTGSGNQVLVASSNRRLFSVGRGYRSLTSKGRG